MSNFLSVFLALAAKNIYNVVRRILRVLNQRNENKTQVLDAGIAGPDRSDSSVTELPGSVSPSLAIRIPENTVTTTSRRVHIAPNTDSEVDLWIPPLAQGPSQRHIQRLEIIDESHDTETMPLADFSPRWGPLYRFVLLTTIRQLTVAC
jgi:hypothetical protein